MAELGVSPPYNFDDPKSPKRTAEYDNEQSVHSIQLRSREARSAGSMVGEIRVHGGEACGHTRSEILRLVDVHLRLERKATTARPEIPALGIVI